MLLYYLRAYHHRLKHNEHFNVKYDSNAVQESDRTTLTDQEIDDDDDSNLIVAE